MLFVTLCLLTLLKWGVCSLSVQCIQ